MAQAPQAPQPPAPASPAPKPSHSPTADLAEQLDESHSATIFVDLDLNDADAKAMLTADPPLHVEHDDVRGLWAVRRATEDEAAAAKAASRTPASSTAA